MAVLFGETGTPTISVVGNYAIARKFTSGSAGTARAIAIYSLSSGNAKVALYDDNGGSPGDLLADDDSGTAVSADTWNVISIPDTSISATTDYWIAVNGDTSGVVARLSGSGGSGEFYSSTYSSWTAPDPWPSSSTDSNEYAFQVRDSVSTSYESDLGTGAMTLGSGSPTATLGKAADLGTGALSLGSDDLTVTDAALGTGVLSLGSTGVGSIASLYADLTTGNLSLGANGVGVFDRYESDLGTGNMVLGATRLKEPDDVSAGNLNLGADPLQTVDAALLDYNQGRYFAIPAERMRGCVWAENFASAYKTRQIGGTVPESVSYTNSVVLDGLSYVTYNEQPLTDVFSAVVKFSASAVSNGLLFGTLDGLGVDGWRIWVDATGIRANHSDGTSLGTQCGIDFDYADGDTHTVTYSVDMVSGDHSLYVDTLDDSQSTTATGTIGTGRTLAIGGVGFNGTVEVARLFASELTSEEHLVYYNDSLSSIFTDSIGTYRCDTVCDQTDHVWTKTLNLNDLTKGDGVSSGYPTHNTQGYYEFDGVDDYVSEWPTQPTLHTDSIAKTTSYPDGVPTIQQVNDDTVKTLLTTSGSYTGNLHSLVLCTGELTDLEKNHLEYEQLKRLWRETHVNPFVGHLIRDGIATLVGHFDVHDSAFDDYSDTAATMTPTQIAYDDGLSFPATNSVLTVTDDVALRSDSVSIYVSGDDLFIGTAFPTAGYLVDKGLNYSLHGTYTDTAVTITFNGQAFTQISNDGIESIAVSCIDGQKPRLYINGEFVETASASVTVDNTATDDMLIGNASGGGTPLAGSVRQIVLSTEVLTDQEIRLLHQYSEGFVTAPVYTEPTSLLADWNMDESGTAYWSSGSGAVLSKIEENRADQFGVRTLQVECPVADAYSGALQTGLLTSGVDYRVYGWYKCDGVNANATLGNVTGTDIAVIGCATAWTQFDETFTAGGGNIYLGLTGNVATNDTVWYDDVVLVEDP